MNQSTFPLLLLASLAAAPLASAQQFKVLPRGMDFVEGPNSFTYPFGRTTAAICVLIEASEITTQQGVITGMKFRQNSATNYASYAKNYKVTAYTVPVAPATMNADPVVNAGSAPATIVFQGNVTVPAAAPLTTLPAPFGIQLPFSTPYAYDGSLGNLMLVIETDDTTPLSASYAIDSVTFRTSTITGFASNLDLQGCAGPVGSLTLSTDPLAAIVGGSITQSFTSSATGAFPVLLAGLSFTIAPFDLTPQGLPGCTSWMGPAEFRAHFENVGGGYSPLVWALPNTPSIEGIPLAGQALGVAASTQLPECVTSNGQAVCIGSSGPVVLKINTSFRLAGTWSKSGAGVAVAPVIEFEGVFP